MKDIVERKEKIIVLIAGGFDSLEPAMGLSLDFVKDFCPNNKDYKNQIIMLSFKLRTLVKEKRTIGTDTVKYLNDCGGHVMALLNVLDLIEEEFISLN